MCAIRSTLGFFLIAATLPSLGAAQTWDEPWSDPRDRPPRVDFSVAAGALVPTDWSDLVVLGTLSPVSGVLEQVLVRDVSVEPDVLYDASVTYWRDRYGFRVQGAFSQSSMSIGGGPDFDGPLTSVGVNTWFYDVRGAIGLLDYWPSRRVWPYVFIGFGGITYDLDRTITPPLLTFIERGIGRPAGPGQIIVVDDDGGSEFLLAIDELNLESQFAFSFGVGTDLRLPFAGGGIGLRLELSDHVAASPLTVRITELSSSGGLGRDDTVDFPMVHHLRASAGLVIQIGK